MVERPRALRTVDGTNTGAFVSGDWALAIAVATVWGSSFLWTDIGLDSLDPSAVAFMRVSLGAVALWSYPATRRPVDRAAWPGIAIVAVAGNAGPALLFALGQQHVESAVAGMVNATTPLAVLVVTTLLLRRVPGPRQVVGLLVGMLGVGAMSVPNMSGASAAPLGMVLLVVAVAGYGVSNNVVVPLQQTYGAPAVVGRALVIGSVLLMPLGVLGLGRSDPAPGSIAAVTILGVAGTGFARTLSAVLAGRAGAARASLPTYLAPVIAITLGVMLRGDRVETIELAGTTLVLVGAFFTSRGQRRAVGREHRPAPNPRSGFPNATSHR
jgi:drug/metabolite transporter (DMT)-like permease